MRRAVLVLVFLASGCTIVGGAAGAGITKAHDSRVDAEDEWGYLVPVVSGAVVGLVIDILLLRSLGEGLGSLAKQ